jgi:hypothetical protein
MPHWCGIKKIALKWLFVFAKGMGGKALFISDPARPRCYVKGSGNADGGEGENIVSGGHAAAT